MDGADSPFPVASLAASLARREHRADSSTIRRRRPLTARTDLLPFEERPALVRTREVMQRWQGAEASTEMGNDPPSSTAAEPMAVDEEQLSRPTPPSKPLPLPVQQLLPNGRSSAMPSDARSSSGSMPPTEGIDGKPQPSFDYSDAWWHFVGKDVNSAGAVPELGVSFLKRSEVESERTRLMQVPLTLSDPCA